MSAHPRYAEFIELLEREDRGRSIGFCQRLLADGTVDIPTLYSGFLAPSLNHMECVDDEESCIWKEHVRSSIVRSIIENCYPSVLKERDARFGPGSVGKVLVACPVDELHELGARMVTDYFTMAGFEALFVGANTPMRVIESAVRSLRPAIVAISVTNYYHLFAAEKVISVLRGVDTGKRFKVVVGGRAFEGHPEAVKQVGADILAEGFDDILVLRKGV
ncbi:MAG: cobalamin B12-binding domain-containing protein [Thermoplasmata archaeon]|jgi:methanogenic corrinoid protein MtbC1|nr:cobalamin B12-binding domain-containing protein [Thermoplasmata archaeon]